MSPCLPPLRTARDGFRSSRSSLLQRDKIPASMDVLVTCSMEVDQVVSPIRSSIFDAYPVMDMERLAVE